MFLLLPAQSDRFCIPLTAALLSDSACGDVPTACAACNAVALVQFSKQGTLLCREPALRASSNATPLLKMTPIAREPLGLEHPKCLLPFLPLSPVLLKTSD